MDYIPYWFSYLHLASNILSCKIFGSLPIFNKMAKDKLPNQISWSLISTRLHYILSNNSFSTCHQVLDLWFSSLSQKHNTIFPTYEPWRRLMWHPGHRFAVWLVGPKLICHFLSRDFRETLQPWKGFEDGVRQTENSLHYVWYKSQTPLSYNLIQ